MQMFKVCTFLNFPYLPNNFSVQSISDKELHKMYENSKQRSYFDATTILKLRPNLKNLSHGLNLSRGSNFVPLKVLRNTLQIEQN